MEAVQIRQGLKVHFIKNKESAVPVCGLKTVRGFNLMAFKHSPDCECLNCRKILTAKGANSVKS